MTKSSISEFTYQCVLRADLMKSLSADCLLSIKLIMSNSYFAS